MSEWSISIGQMSLTGGRRSDQAGGALVSDKHRSRWRHDRGQLCVLVEASGEVAGRDALTQQIALHIEQEYLKHRGSITSALQQALLAANRLLHKANQNSLPQERRTAGASCLVVRDQDVYLAQSGPALVYLFREGQIARYPERSPWLDGAPPAETGMFPLGQQETAQVELFHVRAQVWDTFVLCESRLAQLVSAHDLVGEVGSGGVKAALDAVATLAEEQDMAALALALDRPEGAEAKAGEGSTFQATPVEPGAKHPPTREAVQGMLERLPLESALSRAGQASRAAWKAAGHGLGTLLKQMVPSPEPDAGPSTPRSASNLFRTIMIILAILIPILVGVAVTSVLLRQPEPTPPVPRASLLEQANGLWDEATLTDDPSSARTLLSQAQSLLDQLLAAEPDNAAAMELRSHIQIRLDEVDQVRRLQWVGSWKQYGNGSNPSRVVVNGTELFVLDQGLDRVYHHEIDPAALGVREDTLDRILLEKGQSVGGAVVGELIDMTWMPVGGNRDVALLVILYQGGGVVAYNPTTDILSRLAVGSVDSWLSPRLVGSYYGRLYVLDEQQGQILRYWPTSDGYGGTPDYWLTAPQDVSDVIDMAIGDEIYLLHASGRVEKMAAGQSTAFELTGLTAPLQSPSALFTGPTGEVASLYVADRGNNRIVQFQKDGTFERQFKLAEGDALRDVTSLFVDELGGTGTTRGMIIFLSRQTLYITTIPE